MRPSHLLSRRRRPGRAGRTWLLPWAAGREAGGPRWARGRWGGRRAAAPPRRCAASNSARRGRGPGREGREGARRGEPSPAALGGGRGAFDGGRLPQPQLSSRIAAAASSSARPPSLPPPTRPPAAPAAPESRAASRRCRSFSAILARSRPLSSSAQANMAPAELSEGTRQGRHGPSAAASTTPAPAASHAAAPRGTMGLVGGRGSPPPGRGHSPSAGPARPAPSRQPLGLAGLPQRRSGRLRGGSAAPLPPRAAETPRAACESALSPRRRCSCLRGFRRSPRSP